MARGARMAPPAAIVVAVALILTGCGGEDPPAASGTTAPAATAPAAARIPTVRVVDGSPEGGPLRVAGHSGETLRFAVISDAADELHVHGFDVLRALAPGERVVVELAADAQGIFEAELHGSGELVARLVVEP